MEHNEANEHNMHKFQGKSFVCVSQIFTPYKMIGFVRNKFTHTHKHSIEKKQTNKHKDTRTHTYTQTDGQRESVCDPTCKRLK
jgi:hypothetical protein